MMALTSAIRRASSRVVPLALHHHHHRSSILLAAVSRPSRNTLQKSLFPSFINHYSSKPRSDASLLRIIDTKLQCAVDWLMGISAGDVLKNFEIEDHSGQHSITLRREYKGETITVEVHMPCRFTSEENDNDSDSEENDKADQVAIPMDVRVSKKEGSSLEFGVTALHDHLQIDSLSIKHSGSSEGILVDRYLDEDLQKAFRKYLRIRGIRNSTIHFLYCFMFDKDCRDHVACLKKLQEFFQA